MIRIKRRNPQIKSGAVSDLPWLIIDLPGDVPAVGVRVMADMMGGNPGRQPRLNRQVAHGGQQQHCPVESRFRKIKTDQNRCAANNRQQPDTSGKARKAVPQHDADHQGNQHRNQRSEIKTVIHGKAAPS
jgi:hypothetical protein